jgi:hypothetical protein
VPTAIFDLESSASDASSVLINEKYQMETQTKLERIFLLQPAFDKRHSNPEQNYGIGTVSGMLVVKGPSGAVHFSFLSGIHLPHIEKELIAKYGSDLRTLGILSRGMGTDVGYHSPKPMFEGQNVVWPAKMKKKNPDLEDPGNNATQKERLAYIENIEWEKIGDTPPVCQFIGVPCYCDGSAMRADDWYQVFLEEGYEKIFEMLEKEYQITFGTDDKLA